MTSQRAESSAATPEATARMRSISADSLDADAGGSNAPSGGGGGGSDPAGDACTRPPLTTAMVRTQTSCRPKSSAKVTSRYTPAAECAARQPSAGRGPASSAGVGTGCQSGVPVWPKRRYSSRRSIGDEVPASEGSAPCSSIRWSSQCGLVLLRANWLRPGLAGERVGGRKEKHRFAACTKCSTQGLGRPR